MVTNPRVYQNDKEHDLNKIQNLDQNCDTLEVQNLTLMQ